MAYRSVLGGPVLRIRSTSVYTPLTRRTAYRTLHACVKISAFLGLLDEVWSGMDEGMISEMLG